MSREPVRETHTEEGEGGREVGERIGDRDRLQHLTGCPGELLKVMERERATYGARAMQDRKRHVLWQEGWLKELTRRLHEKNWNLHRLFSDNSSARAVQMEAHMLHTQTETRATCSSSSSSSAGSLLLSRSATHFVYSEVFCGGIHPSKLFAQLFCRIFCIRSHLDPFHTFPSSLKPCLHRINTINIKLSMRSKMSCL